MPGAFRLKGAAGGGGSASGAPTDATYWTTTANSSLSAEVAGPIEPFSARMQVDSTTSITLQRYKGKYCFVNGEMMDPGTGGVAATTAATLLLSLGTSGAAAMASNTLYYMYLANSAAAFGAGTLRGSITAPSLFNGVYYLGATGDAANWRFAGYVQTSNTITFLDSVVFRNCINYYNRRPLPIFLAFGYVDNNTSDTFTLAAQAMGLITAATANGGYIANGEDAIIVDYQVLYTEISGRVFAISIGDNSVTLQTNTYIRVGTAAAGLVTSRVCAILTPAVGYRTINALAFVDTSTHTIQVSSSNAYGGTVDPHTSWLLARVMG